MNGTPRLHSAFPVTPQTDGFRRRTQTRTSTTPSRNANPRLPSVSALKTDHIEADQTPVISTDIVSPATQRFAVLCVYLAFWVWRLWDLWLLVQDDTESLWQFLKWLFIDAAFLFGVPALRIPWLEWSPVMVTLLFIGHALINFLLMFRIAGPFTLFFELVVKMFWDSEIAIGESQVKAGKHTDSSALLSGRHIIHILPEGSAIINPEREPFCIGDKTHQVQIPIAINQTQPILMELLRIDLDTGANETIPIKKSEAKSLMSNARRAQKGAGPTEPLLLHYPVKKTGRYTIRKVIDESQLAVRPRPAEAIVVSCPQARIDKVEENKCRSDLSSVTFEVEGTPPLQLRYRKTINGQQVSSSFQSIQPDGFLGPPLTTEQTPGTITKFGDVSRARSQRIRVPVGEVMLQTGKWEYALDEVQDSLGNVVSFVNQFDDDGNPKSKSAGLQQFFTVHDRPLISLWSHSEKQDAGCDLQNPLKIAEGQHGGLPIKFGILGKPGRLDLRHKVKLKFTPENAVQNNGEHSDTEMKFLEVSLNNPTMSYDIRESGLYTLESVATDFCSGEVAEPSSCLVEHPQRPQLNVKSDKITDKCARMPIGLSLDLEFSGTPPFSLQYSVSKDKNSGADIKTVQSDSRRQRLELKPEAAGHYTYRFLTLQDRYYREALQSIFEQDVKPSASARFASGGSAERLCKGAQAQFPVHLVGEPPFSLVYEIVHGGKRKRETVNDIAGPLHSIKTDDLPGGEYELALVSVSDTRDCPETLNAVRKFTVRHQQPKAAFGFVDGKRAVQRVEGTTVELPIRLTGDGPWTVAVKNTDDASEPDIITTDKPNAFARVKRQGRYELYSIKDAICTGEVDSGAKAFTVSWVQRPQLFISESPKIKSVAGAYVRDEVCEGEEDFVELAFSGTPPFNIKYEEHAVPDHGSKWIRPKTLPAALGAASVQLETSKAGQYQYKFTELTDANYGHDSKRFKPVSLRQKVNPRPTARFKNPGRTYSYCTVEGHSEDSIPIILTGQPPFYLEIELKHAGSSKAEVISVPSVPKETYDLQIPHPHRQHGHAHVSIRKVRDSRGCQSTAISPPHLAPRVQISVHDPPSITALEPKEDYCVGDRLSFRLSGAPPFTIFYTWKGKERKASSPTALFSRVADDAGAFVVTAVADAASDCRARVADGGLAKSIHALPRAKIARGNDVETDIHEGGEVEIAFELVGEPPFEFTYTRAEVGGKGAVLETKTERTEEVIFRVRASEEGVYEVISVRDRWCVASRQAPARGKAGGGQKLLLQN